MQFEVFLPRPNPAAHAQLQLAHGDAVSAAVGRLVRMSRAKRGMTRRQLAQSSGASERYLAQIEGGQGNPSVIILKAIADALDLPVIELIPRINGRGAAMTHILDLIGRLPEGELSAVAELIERHSRADAGN